MDVFRSFATDDSKEISGVWQPLGGGAEILVARSGNRAYARLLTKLFEQHQKVLESKDESADELSDQIMIEVMAKTILLDWKTIEFKGMSLEYTLDNAKMVLGVKDFRRHVAKLSEDVEKYRYAEEVDTGKP